MSVFLVFKLSSQLRSYFSLNTSAQALFTDWKVVEKDPSSFALTVFYQFYDGNQVVPGFVELARPSFLSAPSAERFLQKFSKKQWDVLYNRTDSKISSLQKLFPFKECIQVFLALGALSYFLCLKKIVDGNQLSNRFFKKR